MADIALWLVALVAGLAPRRVWPRLPAALPVVRAAAASGIVTLTVGFLLGIDGFLSYGLREASLSNAWMLRNVARAPGSDQYVVSAAPYGISALTLFTFLFLTPLGWLSMYLVITGTLRAISAAVDDPRGDPLLSGVHWAATTLAARTRTGAARLARERREGVEVPDVLATGEWAGLPADYVVIASRRRPEWTQGAIIMTSSDWYRLGEPVDREVHGALRTLYPLEKLDAVEVVRRGIEYELPPLTRRLRPRAPGTAATSSE